MHTLESLMLLPVSGFIFLSLTLSLSHLISLKVDYTCPLYIKNLASHSCTVHNLPTSIQPLLGITIELHSTLILLLPSLVTYTHFLPQ